MGQTGSGDRKVDLDKIRKVDAFSSEEEKHPLLLSRKDPPPDTCHLAYIILYLHGVGHLLPWNFFITAYPVSSSLTIHMYTEAFSHACSLCVPVSA